MQFVGKPSDWYGVEGGGREAPQSWEHAVPLSRWGRCLYPLRSTRRWREAEAGVVTETKGAGLHCSDTPKN